MDAQLSALANWLLGPELPNERNPGHLWARWIFLRALGLIYFSAFYSLLFQIKGLIGPDGILPATDYLQAVSGAFHSLRYWFAPTLLWFGASDHALMLICWVGIVASLLVVLNFWPRAMLAVCFVCFLSFVSAAQDFSGYQSDGMLLEAGFISLFFAPPGIWPGLARARAPSRLSRFLLQWEWFRIYFESGLVKILSGDQSWRNLTAMDDYYQNGPLPSWIGWYVQHLPHWFHASAVIYTFAVELFIVWMLFLPRRFRILCFFIVTPFEISIILTANYTFLNYLVLSLGFLLLDDRFLEWLIPQRLRELIERKPPVPPVSETQQEAQPGSPPESWRARWRGKLAPVRMAIAGFFLLWVLYATSALLAWTLFRDIPLFEKPVQALEPFRIANRYGLFAVMTHARYEIEFQGSLDGKTWLAYPFRYKPQDVSKPPGIYAPYQPRFEWNLWFASLGNWREFHFVVWTEERLLRSEPDVLELFAANPFAGGLPPTQVRAVLWQYWFTDLKTKRSTGNWWRREFLGNYAPALERLPDGKIILNDVPITQAPPP
jgi:lipase maturation factor 1